MISHVLLLTSAFFALSPTLTDAHGFMATPRTRGSYCSQKVQPDLAIPQGCGNIDYCPHCQNGGGVGSVSSALGGVFTPYRSDNRQHAGLCGDPIGSNDHMVGGQYVPYAKAPIVAGYEPGTTIDFAVQIDTHHNGFFEFYLCDLDACGTNDIQETCFTQGHCQKLERDALSRCENPTVNEHFECGPIDNVGNSFKGRWYLPCRPNGPSIAGGSSGTMRYKLPPGLTCQHNKALKQ